MTIAIVPNTRTNWYDPQIAAGAPVVIQNINYLTGDPNSVLNSSFRFIQDVFKRWTATAVREGLVLGGQGTADVTISAGYAIIQGRHIYNDATVNVSATLADDDYYIVLTTTENAESQTRDPSNDTIAASAEADGTYTAASNKLVLGKITVASNIATVVTSYSQVGEVRTGHIMPPQLPDGSSLTEVNIWTGEIEKRKMATFTGDNFNIVNDGGKVQFGITQQLSMYHSGTHGFIDNTVGQLEINAGTNFVVDQSGSIIFRDADNADQEIFNLSPTALTIGQQTDNVATKIFGKLILSDLGVAADALRLYNDASFLYLDADSGLSSGIKFRMAGSSPFTSMVDKLTIAPTTITSSVAHRFTLGLGLDAATLTFATGAGGAATFGGNVYGTGFGLDASVLSFATGGSGLATFGGAVTATSFAGILEANILSRIVAESITNTWTFDSAGGIVFGNQLAGTDPTLTSSHATLQQLLLTGELNISSIVAGIADYDRFLVSDTGRIKYRTGAEVLSDIGAQPAAAFATPVTVGSANSVGSLSTYSRSDHVHQREHSIYTPPAFATPVTVAAANAAGSLSTYSRSDHVHQREHAIYSHPASHTDGEVSDSIGAGGLSLANLQKFLAYSSSYKTWFPCVVGFQNSATLSGRSSAFGEEDNIGSTDGTWFYTMAAPSSINDGAYNMWTDRVRIDVADADIDDYIDSVSVYSVIYNSAVTHISDPTNRTTVGRYEIGWTAAASSDFSKKMVQIVIVATTAGDIALRGVSIRGYYA